MRFSVWFAFVFPPQHNGVFKWSWVAEYEVGERGGGGGHVSSCINQYSVLTFHFPRLSSTLIGDCMNTPLNSTLGRDVMINTNRPDVIMFWAMGIQSSYGKWPHPLLWVGSRTARGKSNSKWCSVRGFRSEVGAFLGYYAASGGNSLPTFQDELSVSLQGQIEGGTDRLPPKRR